MSSSSAWHELDAQLEQVVTNIKQVEKQEVGEADAQAALQESLQTLSNIKETVSSVLEETTMGECRMAVPFAGLQPIIDENGQYRWCCTHPEEHCAPPI